MSSKGELKRRIAEKSYRHNFTDYSGIDVMTCNITGSNTQEKDIVKLEDAAEVLDEAATEFPDFEKLKLKYASFNKTGIDISALKAFQMQAEEWFKKWSGIAEVSP